MANIQVVEGSQVASGGNIGGQMNAGQLMAEGAGMESLGRSLAGVGEIAGGLASRLQSAKNAADLASAQMRMNKAFADYQNKLETEPDETKWTEGWQKTAQSVGDELMSEDLSPDVRDALEQGLQEWEQDTSIKVQGAQTKRTVQRFKSKFVLAAEEAYKNGRTDEGDQFIESAKSSGVMFEDEGAQIMTRGRQVADMNEANRAILLDPLKAEEDLNSRDDSGSFKNYGNIDENQRRALVVEARQEMSARRGERMRQIQDDLNGGRIYSTEELQKDVDAKLLTATQMKHVLYEQTSSGLDPVANERSAALLRRSREYSPEKDKTQEELVSIMGEMYGLPANVKQAVQRNLRKTETSGAKTTQTKLAMERINRAYDDHKFGLVAKESGAYLDPVAADKANDRYREEVIAFDEFMAANPNATLRQQDEFITERFRVEQTNPEVVTRSFFQIINPFDGR